jgi:hypothetical protein
MSTITTPNPQADTAPSVVGNLKRTRALSVRRGFLVAAPVLAGLFAIVGAVADPAAGISGHEMYKLYAENPAPLQFKSLGFHWSYAFWIGTALMIAPYVRAKGAWVANVAALLGFVGMTTLPGLLAVDWYDSALGQLYGVGAVERVHDHMDATMWGIPVFMTPGMLGLMLALPLAAIALLRAGLVRWWAVAAVVAAFVAFLGSNVTPWGCVLTTVFLSVFAFALARATRAPANA